MLERLPEYHPTNFRPSGTEQILRVYVEAQSKEEARLLAEKLAQLVRDNAN